MRTDASSARGLKQQIYLDLKDKLINCIYPPGTELNELMLTEEYKVSRTPVREAISQLELEGYVRVLPKRGICISEVSVEDVLQIFQTRCEIEPVTLKLAYPFLKVPDLLRLRSAFEKEETDLMKAFRLDMEMHIYLVDQCGNVYLKDMMHRLFSDTTRVVIATGQTRIKIHNARQEHIQILDALIEGAAPDRCADLLRSHVQTCRAAALRYFSSKEYQDHLKETGIRIRDNRKGQSSAPR